MRGKYLLGYDNSAGQRHVASERWEANLCTELLFLEKMNIEIVYVKLTRYRHPS